MDQATAMLIRQVLLDLAAGAATVEQGELRIGQIVEATLAAEYWRGFLGWTGEHGLWS